MLIFFFFILFVQRHEERVIIISSKESDIAFSDAEIALKQIATLILKVILQGLPSIATSLIRNFPSALF